jgi:hypothetical protein
MDTKVRSAQGTSWRTASRFHSLTDEEIASAIERSSKLFRAVPADDYTGFSVITLDGKSGLDALVEHASRIARSLEKIGVHRSSLYKESGSENWQIFVFWDSLVSVSELNDLFGNWLATVCSDIDSLSVFPGGDSLVLPLQPGFAWLNGKGASLVTREELSLGLALERFISDMDDAINQWSAVRESLRTIDVNASSADIAVEPPVVPNSAISPCESNAESDLEELDSTQSNPKTFTDQGTNRESIVAPEEVAACSNMQQLSLFPTTNFERGPPLMARP